MAAASGTTDIAATPVTNPARFTINGMNYLLVEFADSFIPPSSEEILQQFLSMGIISVVTHPERNPVVRDSPDRLRHWISISNSNLTQHLFADKLAGISLLRSRLKAHASKRQGRI